jgi:signal transduction histidine kinase
MKNSGKFVSMKSLYQLLFFVLGFALQSQSQIRVVDYNLEAYELAPDSAVVLDSGEMSIELQDSSGTWHQVGRIVAKNTSVVTKPWFIILLTTLLGFCAYLFYKFISNKSRKEAVMEAKLAHLERSALQAQMNPHFIFNSLNSIQSYIANNENDRANRFLAKFAKLIRSMLNHSRAQKVTLQEEIDSLTLYMDLEKMRFKDKFDFEVHIDEDIETYDIQIPPLLIQPYLENAIIHGLAQKRSQGKINLYYILEGKYLHATVTDNGIGIEQSKQQKKGESLHKSVGMTVTQKRLEMLDEGNTDKKVFIEEIKDRKGEVLGTKVEVKILIT